MPADVQLHEHYNEAAEGLQELLAGLQRLVDVRPETSRCRLVDAAFKATHGLAHVGLRIQAQSWLIEKKNFRMME